MATTINTTFFQLVAAFFIAFLLAHMATKYFERFERFPAPLVSAIPGALATGLGSEQGRDYIPHRFRPTVPPGPAVPFPLDSDPTQRESLPPATPPPQLPTVAVTAPAADLTRAPELPYAMTNDEFLSFVPTAMSPAPA